MFALSTTIHLYASKRNDKPLRDKSKPFILLGLIGLYYFSVDKISITVVLALIFSWIGDLFLIKKGVKWFAIGGISFLVSHIFFILSYIPNVNFNNIDITLAIILGIIYFSIVTFLFTKLKKHLPKALFYPMYLYLLINGTMNCFAIFRYLSIFDTAGLITLIGAVLFFISDCTLFFVRFDKNTIFKTHFLVMFTYSIGELLITLGLILG